MSTREEDRQKNNCPSRGLGLAAAAIGVGVGAALYYLFSKRPENPDGEGSTSGWSCEPAHAFNLYQEESDTSMENQCDNNASLTEESDYTTISEGTTTDTSIHESNESSSDYSESDGDSHIDLIPQEDLSDEDLYNIESLVSSFDHDPYETRVSSEPEEWDITDSSLDIPEQTHSLQQLSPLRFIMMRRFRSLFNQVGATREQEQRDMLRAQALSEEEQIKYLSAQRFRERSWSLEDCSICFEIMLNDQQLMRLPCAHNFHAACIAPWLAEQQTCPNCRKAAD